ncbi:proline-rich protein 13 isoform X1 [Pantherophis guttatus]|uniref:Proline-rich protein 13 isoform X1 n=1 Tax=Pantherophis guttatus TaxID=94885 RepID=A0A6P9B9U2_PANGU|nr:proline-rich protein 13 isoform X1 [Pantherophis guttatus]
MFPVSVSPLGAGPRRMFLPTVGRAGANECTGNISWRPERQKSWPSLDQLIRRPRLRGPAAMRLFSCEGPCGIPMQGSQVSSLEQHIPPNPSYPGGFNPAYPPPVNPAFPPVPMPAGPCPVPPVGIPGQPAYPPGHPIQPPYPGHQPILPGGPLPPPVPGMPGGIGVNPLLPGAAAAGVYVTDKKAAKKMKKKMKKAHKMHKQHKHHKHSSSSSSSSSSSDSD